MLTTSIAERPIAQEEARAILLPWLMQEQPLVLAVSGGPDSTALMHLVASVADTRARRNTLHVATVDHRLRPQSRADAEMVMARALELGLSARLLSWEGAKPASVSQEAARDARYALIKNYADEIGINAVMTAHTLDDQAETVLMRLIGGSGPRGLGAMRSESQSHGLRLIRPLLGLAKARLVATCQVRGWHFSEDASNHNPRFARVRVRRVLQDLSKEGLSAQRLTRLAHRMQRVDEALDAQADAAFKTLKRRRDEGLAFDSAGFMRLPDEIALRVLSLSFGAEPGAGAPRLEKIEHLFSQLRLSFEQGRTLRRTLGGCLISVSAEEIAVTREEPRQSRRIRDKPYQRAQLGFSPPAP